MGGQCMSRPVEENAFCEEFENNDHHHNDNDDESPTLSSSSFRANVLEPHHNKQESRRASLFRIGSHILSRTKKGNFKTMSTLYHHHGQEEEAAAHYNMAEADVIRSTRNGNDDDDDNNSNNRVRVHVSWPPGVIGLMNLGNTCFLNASLQCLSNTIPLTDYFLGYDYCAEINHQNPLGTNGTLVKAYADLMKRLWLSNNNNKSTQLQQQQVIKPSKFKSKLAQFAPQFQGTHQHDAQELLAFLLDGIHEDLNLVQSKPYIQDKDCDGSQDALDAAEAWKNYLLRNKSLIVDVFQGQFRTKCTCNTCGHVNIRFEPYMYLSLPISQDCTTLQDCLDLYLKEDMLEGGNQWYCPKCKTHVDATRKIDIWVLPPILIIHLKRFKYNDFGHVGSKNTITLQYPLQDWNLSEVCLGTTTTTTTNNNQQTSKYDLYAVSNHLGSLASGHYTAHALNRFNDEWYEFNDSICRPMKDLTEIQQSSSAYVLFYNRCENDSQSSSLLSSSLSSSTSSSSNNHSRGPLIRRQSVSRPDLWPHAQVLNADFSSFCRSSRRLVSVSIKDTDDNDNDDDGNNLQTMTSVVRMESISEGNAAESSEQMSVENETDDDNRKVAAVVVTTTTAEERRQKFARQRDEPSSTNGIIAALSPTSSSPTTTTTTTRPKKKRGKPANDYIKSQSSSGASVASVAGQ